MYRHNYVTETTHVAKQQQDNNKINDNLLDL